MTERAEGLTKENVHQWSLTGGTGSNSAPDMWLEAQEAYFSGANALATEVFDFMGQRYKAYAEVMEALPQCQSIGDFWQLEVGFGQATVKAYGDEATKFGALLLHAGNGARGESNDAKI